MTRADVTRMRNRLEGFRKGIGRMRSSVMGGVGVSGMIWMAVGVLDKIWREVAGVLLRTAFAPRRSVGGGLGSVIVMAYHRDRYSPGSSEIGPCALVSREVL